MQQPSIFIVSPDWIQDCVKSKERVDEERYHPRLLNLTPPPPPPKSPTPPPPPVIPKLEPKSEPGNTTHLQCIGHLREFTKVYKDNLHLGVLFFHSVSLDVLEYVS